MIPAPRPGTTKLDPFSQDAIDRDSNKFGKQAYTRAHDARFAKFAAQKKPDAKFDYLHHTEKFICAECGVTALRFIDSTIEHIAPEQPLVIDPDTGELPTWQSVSVPNPEAIAKWQALDAEYQTWLSAHPEA